MAADLFISLPHGSAIQEVHAFQDGVLSILLFNAQQSLLQSLFLFLLFYIGKQVKLVYPFILYYPVRGNRDPAHCERPIGDLVKQLHSCRDNPTPQIGGISQMCTAMGSLWHGPPIVVDVYRAAVGTLIAVFPVIAHIQRQAVRDEVLIGELEDQGIRHFSDNDAGLIIRVE